MVCRLTRGVAPLQPRQRPTLLKPLLHPPSTKDSLCTAALQPPCTPHPPTTLLSDAFRLAQSLRPGGPSHEGLSTGLVTFITVTIPFLC